VADYPPQDPSAAATNRLTIAFLLLWMLGTSAELADDYWQLANVRDAAPAELFYWNTHMLVFSPLHGAALAYAILILGRIFIRRETGVTAPGHWFLAIHGAFCLYGWIHSLFVVAVTDDFLSQIRQSLFLARHTLYGSLAVLGVYGMFAIRANVAWRVMLLLLAADKAEHVAQDWVRFFIRGPIWFSNEIVNGVFDRSICSLPALAAIVGIVLDARRGVKRDFLHWVGVWTLLLLVACEWPSWIWWRQVFR
jgi:hypothetical protein